MADVGVSYQIPFLLHEKQRMMRALMNVRQPMPATEEFLHAQDEELRLQAEDKGIVTLQDVAEANSQFLKSQASLRAERSIFNFQFSILNSHVLLWQGDITRLKGDAIVNAANAQMLGCWAPLHNCIDNCIHSSAGVQLRQECYRLMQAQGHDEPTGQAKITLGYNLPAKHVIHTVGPIIPNGIPTREQERQLASCYRSCLDVAEEAGCESIAFCCISTGVFHFPNERAAEIAVETVASYPFRLLKAVVFNVFLDKDYNIYRRILGK